jgi:hypothetical protein
LPTAEKSISIDRERQARLNRADLQNAGARVGFKASSDFDIRHEVG